MTHLEIQLYNALLLLRRSTALDQVREGIFRFRLTETDVAQVEAALDAYENAATVARLREGLLLPDDERALETAKRLNHK